MAGSAPPRSCFTAENLTSTFGEMRLSAASAPLSSRRRRLLTVMSSLSSGTLASFSPVSASLALSPLTMSTRLPEVWSSPSASA